MDRIATFRSFIERSPKDPFPRYGLAMEQKARGQLDDARASFAELVASFPDYVPAYLQYAAVVTALGDRAAARAILEDGIAAAARKGDAHARGELEAALAEL